MGASGQPLRPSKKEEARIFQHERPHQTYPRHESTRTWDDSTSSPFSPLYLPQIDTRRPIEHVDPSNRHSPYPGHTPPRSSTSSTTAATSPPMHDRESVRLPPIRTSAVINKTPSPYYSLPSVAALEDLDEMSTSDSAAVLKRLRSDECYQFPALKKVNVIKPSLSVQ